MRYEVYIDRLFFLHFGMNCLLLVLTDRLGDYRISRRRLLLTAACAAGGYLAVFLCPALGTEGIFARLPAGAMGHRPEKVVLPFGKWVPPVRVPYGAGPGFAYRVHGAWPLPACDADLPGA